MPLPKIDIDAMSVEARIELIHALEESLERERMGCLLSPEQAAELDRRLERLEREGPAGDVWETVRGRLTQIIDAHSD